MEYDLALFERLNDRYRPAPSVPNPPKRTRQDYQSRAEDRLRQVTKYLDVSGRTVLELGTGHGWLAATMIKEGGASAVTGVDMREHKDWDNLREAHPNLTLLVGDLSQDQLVEPGSMDAVISTAVLEHVERPVQMFPAIHRALRTDGHAWLRFNLHRGRAASHRYRQVFFPWPHLLFEDEVCRAFYRKHHDRGDRFEWVNRLTVGDYLQLCAETGFEVIAVERGATAVEKDIEFYAEFEDVLGRYPALDLETDFLTLLLRKLKRPLGKVPDVGYVERQRALDEALRSFRGRPDAAPSSAADQP